MASSDSTAAEAVYKQSTTAFHDFYQKVYGKRWDSLLQSLCNDVQHVALVNPFANPADVQAILPTATEHPVKELYGCLQMQTPTPTGSTLKELKDEDEDEVDTRFPGPVKDRTGILTHYLLDGASVITARALNTKPGQKVLDMCAAPGGKSLVLAYDLFSTARQNEVNEGESGDDSDEGSEDESDESSDEEATKADEENKRELAGSVNPNRRMQVSNHDPHGIAGYKGMLVCNEISEPRRARLRKVMEGYLPNFVAGRKIQITAQDATQATQQKKIGTDIIPKVLYDLVLVDAPCSSERHLIRNPQELILWSRSRSKLNAQRQYGLLTSALRLCVRGGRVCYSTCALSPLENDDLIAKFVGKAAKSSEKAKPSVACKVVRLEFPIGEPTEYGHMILPDKTGFGPMYICVLQKL